MIEAISASSSAHDVSITHAMPGQVDRISRQTSTPLPSGNRTSRMETSGPDNLVVVEEEQAEGHGQYLHIQAKTLRFAGKRLDHPSVSSPRFGRPRSPSLKGAEQ